MNSSRMSNLSSFQEEKKNDNVRASAQLNSNKLSPSPLTDKRTTNVKLLQYDKDTKLIIKDSAEMDGSEIKVVMHKQLEFYSEMQDQKVSIQIDNLLKEDEKNATQKKNVILSTHEQHVSTGQSLKKLQAPKNNCTPQSLVNKNVPVQEIQLQLQDESSNSNYTKYKHQQNKYGKIGLTSNMKTAARTEVNHQLFSALMGKTSDLDWFMFETKVRQIILELIDPIKQKNDYLLNKEEIQFAESQATSRRLDEIEYIVQKIQTQNNDFSQIKNETDKFTASMSRKFNQMQYEVQHWNERLDRLEMQFEKLHEQQDKMEINFRNVKTSFSECMKTAQDHNMESLQICSDTKRECTAMFGETQKQIKELKRMEKTIEHINENWDIEMKEMCERFEKQNKSFFSRLMESKDQFNGLHDKVSNQLDQNKKQIEYVGSICKHQEETQKSLEYFLDKLLPSKMFSQICNILHNTIGNQNKTMLNNLITIEQRRYTEFLNVFELVNKQEHYEQFEYNSQIPDLPILKQCIKEVSSSKMKFSKQSTNSLFTQSPKKTTKPPGRGQTMFVNNQNLDRVQTLGGSSRKIKVQSSPHQINEESLEDSLSHSSIDKSSTRRNKAQKHQTTIDPSLQLKSSINLPNEISRKTTMGLKQSIITLVQGPAEVNLSSYFGITLSDLEMFKNPKLPSQFIKDMVVINSDGSISMKPIQNDEQMSKINDQQASTNLLRKGTTKRPQTNSIQTTTNNFRPPYERSLTPNEIENADKFKEIESQLIEAEQGLCVEASCEEVKMAITKKLEIEHNFKYYKQVLAQGKQLAVLQELMMDIKSLASANIQKNAVKLQKEEINGIIRDNNIQKIKMEVDQQSTARQIKQMAAPMGASFKHQGTLLKRTNPLRKKSKKQLQPPLQTQGTAQISQESGISDGTPKRSKKALKSQRHDARHNQGGSTNSPSRNSSKKMVAANARNAPGNSHQLSLALTSEKPEREEEASAGKSFTGSVAVTTPNELSGGQGSQYEQQTIHEVQEEIEPEDSSSRQLSYRGDTRPTPVSKQRGAGRGNFNNGCQSSGAATPIGEDGRPINGGELGEARDTAGEEEEAEQESAEYSVDGMVAVQQMKEEMQAEIKALKEQLYQTDFKEMFTELLGESLSMILTEVRTNVVEKIEGFDMIAKIKDVFPELERISDVVVDTKNDLYRQFSIIGVDVKDVYIQLEAAFARTKRERADMNIYMKRIDVEIIKLKTRVNGHIQHTSKQEEFMDDVIKHQEMQLAQDTQDESDRNQMALYGLMDEAKLDGMNQGAGSPQRANAELRSIQVNQQCASCSGHLTFLKKAFKMACLAYIPSNINFNESSISREQMLIIRAKLLDKQRSHVQEIIQQNSKHPHSVSPDFRPDNTNTFDHTLDSRRKHSLCSPIAATHESNGLTHAHNQKYPNNQMRTTDTLKMLTETQRSVTVTQRHQAAVTNNLNSLPASTANGKMFNIKTLNKEGLLKKSIEIKNQHTAIQNVNIQNRNPSQSPSQRSSNYDLRDRFLNKIESIIHMQNQMTLTPHSGTNTAITASSIRKLHNQTELNKTVAGQEKVIKSLHSTVIKHNKDLRTKSRFNMQKTQRKESEDHDLKLGALDHKRGASIGALGNKTPTNYGAIRTAHNFQMSGNPENQSSAATSVNLKTQGVGSSRNNNVRQNLFHQRSRSSQGGGLKAALNRQQRPMTGDPSKRNE